MASAWLCTPSSTALVAIRCMAATDDAAGTRARRASNTTYEVVVICICPVSSSLGPKVRVKTRPGSTTCAGGARMALSMRPNIARLTPTETASVTTAAPAVAGELLSARSAERKSIRRWSMILACFNPKSSPLSRISRRDNHRASILNQYCRRSTSASPVQAPRLRDLYRKRAGETWKNRARRFA